MNMAYPKRSAESENPDIGELAESILRCWCSEHGIAPTKTDIDRHGWDFLLEFPDKHLPKNTTLDGRPPSKTAFVQVKGTANASKRRISVSLKNWESLAKRPEPCFFLILTIEKNDRQVLAAHLVHVDEEHVSRVLKRLRQAEVDGQKSRIHKLSLDLTWDDRHQLSTPTSDAFVEALAHAVGDDSLEYTRTKIEHIRTCGVDGHPVHLSMTLPTMPFEEAERQFAEFGVGLRSSVEINSMTISNVRFGIPIQQSSSGPESGFRGSVEIPDLTPGATGHLVFQEPSGQGEVTLPCEVYSSQSVIPWIRPEASLLRLATPLLELLFQSADDEPQVNLRIGPMGSSNSLKLLAKTSRACLMLSDAENQNVRVHVVLDGRTWMAATANSNFTIEEHLLQAFSALDNAGYVARVVGIDDDEIVSGAQIIRQWQQFLFMRGLFDPTAGPLSISRGSVVCSEVPQKEIAVLKTASIVIGKKGLVATAALIGTPSFPEIVEPDGRLHFDLPVCRAECISRRILPASEIPGFDYQPSLKAAAEALDKRGNIDAVFLP